MTSSRLTRTVHVQARAKWGLIAELAPDVAHGMARALAAGAPGAQDPEKVRALGFVDPDGEAHVFVLSEEGRKKLVSDMTGVVLQ